MWKVDSEMKKIMPQVGDEVRTPTCGCCKVVSVNYLRQIIKTESVDKEIPDEWDVKEIVKLKNNQNNNGANESDGIDS